MQGEDLSAAYASADAFFTPSESETLGFVVLEAMASGTPVVAARAGGIPDIVDRDGETVGDPTNSFRLSRPCVACLGHTRS